MGLWDEGKEVVVVVGCRGEEVAWGVGVLPPRGRYRAHMLSIAWPLKIRGGACRGTMRDGVGVVVDAMARCIG